MQANVKNSVSPSKSSLTRLINAPSGKLVLALFLIANLLNLIMMMVTLPQVQQLAAGLAPFDIALPGYDRAYAQEFLSNLGEVGRQYYLKFHMSIDMIYPALYAIGGALLWIWSLNKLGFSNPILKWGALLPVLSGAADYVENTTIFLMLAQFPDIANPTVTIASTATVSKTILLVGFLVLLVLLLLSFGTKKLFSRV